MMISYAFCFDLTALPMTTIFISTTFDGRYLLSPHCFSVCLFACLLCLSVGVITQKVMGEIWKIGRLWTLKSLFERLGSVLRLGLVDNQEG